MNVSVVSRELFGDQSLKDAPSLLRKLRRGMLLFYVSGCLMMIGAAIWASLEDYQKSVDTTGQLSMTLARSLAEQAALSLSSVEQSMQALASEIRAEGGTEHAGEHWLHEHLKLRQGYLPQVRGIIVIDRNGILTAHSGEFPVKRLKLSDRAYFNHHSSQGDSSSRIGEPLISRMDYRWLIPLTLRINDSKGTFDGVILAGVEPDYFLHFYESLTLQRGIRIQILRWDGVLLLGYPLDIHRLGTSIPSQNRDGFFPPSKAGSAGSDRQFMAQVSSHDIPVRIRILTDTSHILSRYHHDLRLRIITLLGIIAVLTTIFLFLLRQTRRMELVETRLRLSQLACDASPDMIIWCERTGKNVYANRQLAIFTGYSFKELQGLNVQTLMSMKDLNWTQLCSETSAGRPKTIEASLRKKDHSQGIVELTVFPLTEKGYSLLCIQGKDRTEFQAKQAELMQHQEHLQEMMNKRTEEIRAVLAANPLSVILSINEHIKSVNPAFETLFGYSLNSIAGLPESVIHASTPHYLGLRNTIRNRISRGGTYRGEVELRRSDGSIFWAQIFARALQTAPPDSGTVYIVEDVSNQRSSAQALRQSEQVKRTILDTALDGFALIDANRRFIDVNNALCQQTGTSRESIIGKTPDELWGTDLADRIFPREMAPVTEHSRLEICLTSQDITRTFLVSLGLIRNPDGAADYQFVFFSDITEQKSIAHSLAEAKEIAENANQAKSIFLTNMSHELRTPMHAILSFAELGAQKAEDCPPHEVLRYFERISQSGRHLLALLNDLLEMSRMVPGEQRFRLGEHILQQTMSATLSEIASQLEEKHLKVIHDETTKAISIEYDRMGITQIILNLMSNAIRFSPNSGKIHIHYLRVPARDNYPAMYGFSIRDEGPGIPPDQIGQVNQILSGHAPETGLFASLGLSLCWPIIHKHRGSMRATNHTDGGAVLTVLLPGQTDPDGTSARKSP